MTDLSELKGKKICAAVSGGVDSMTLLFLLFQKAEKTGFSLCALTCEHGLRGKDAKEDVKLVEKYCKKLGVELYSFSADCKKRAKKEKCSVETAARNFRRECYFRVLENYADYIATAHHENDEAETVLFRLARGASLTGASAMEKKDGRFIRPLMHYTKAELYEIAKENGVPFREDETNKEEDFTRNKIRLNILPNLEYAVPGASKNLARFARLAKEDDDLLYRLSAPLIQRDEKGYRVQKSKEKPLFTRACLAVLKSLGVEKDYTAKHLESLYALQSLQTGSKITLPQGITAVKEYDEIAFYQASKGMDEGGRYEVVFTDEPIDEANGLRILRADRDKIPASAVIRTFREGDEFRKFGGGNKSLKKYFIDKKIPLQKRKKIPLLAEENLPKVYAVCGVEISEDIKTDEKTKRTVYIKTAYITSTKE